MTEEGTDDADFLKAVVEDIRKMKGEITELQEENQSLKVALTDPDVLVKNLGLIRYTTPHPEETFDPLNRDDGSMLSSTGPFVGSGEMISKTDRHDELEEWKEAERSVNQ